MILRCTNRLLGELNISKKDLSIDSHDLDDSMLGNWCANIFYINRKKCIIFMNERSYFSVIIFSVTKSDLGNIYSRFREELGRVLLDEDFEGATIQKIVNDLKRVSFGNITNKSILGTMNNHVLDARFLVGYRGGFGVCNLSELVSGLNRMPLKPLGYLYAIEELKHIVADYEDAAVIKAK